MPWFLSSREKGQTSWLEVAVYGAGKPNAQDTMAAAFGIRSLSATDHGGIDHVLLASREQTLVCQCDRSLVEVSWHQPRAASTVTGK